MKTKVPFMWKCSLIMNGYDHIFQNGVPIYSDRVNFIHLTLTLFLIRDVATLGFSIPTITSFLLFVVSSLSNCPLQTKCNVFTLTLFVVIDGMELLVWWPLCIPTLFLFLFYWCSAIVIFYKSIHSLMVCLCSDVGLGHYH